MCNRLKEVVLNIFKKLVAMCNRLSGHAKIEKIRKIQKKTKTRIPKKIAQGLFSKVNPAGSKLARRLTRRQTGVSNVSKCYL
jgi:hypothetical protein